MCNYQRVILFLISFAIQISASGQSEVKPLVINSGMTNNYIRSIQQDAKGLMWIATESGLNSFDGYTSFNYNSTNSGLNANLVNTIFQHDGKLWIGTNGKDICAIDESSNHVSRVCLKGLVINNVIAFCSAAEGGFWMMSRNTIAHYNSRSGKVRLLCSSGNRNAYRCMASDSNGNLIVGNFYHGISVIDSRTGKVSAFSDTSHTINAATIDILCQDKRGNIWIGTNIGLYRINPSGKLEFFPAFGKHQIRAIQVVHNNEVWVSTDNELGSINLSNYKVCSVSEIKRVQYIYEDPYGNVWLGTRGFGVYFVSHRPTAFRSISNEFAQCITHIDNDVFVGGNNKVMMFRNNQLFRSLPVSMGAFTGSVLSISHIDNRSLILAVGGRTLSMDIASGRIVEIKHQGQSISAITFYNDHEARKLWITANDGIYSISDRQVTKEQKLNRILGSQMITGIRRDWQGKLWIATYDNGMYIFSSEERFLSHLSQRTGFFSNSIQHLYADSKGGIWMCTPDGLGRVSDTNHVTEVEVFDQKKGLHDPYIRAINEGQDDKMWIATNNGISILNLANGSIYNYDSSDGIPMNNFSGGLLILADGSMYVTSVVGVLAFDSQSLMIPQMTSQINILGCYTINSDLEHVNERRLTISPERIFKLNRDENSFRIVFGVADLSQSQQVEYAYRVDGITDDWTVIDENYVVFRGLPQGQYKMQIRARLHGQDWKNATRTEAYIHVPGPLWLSWPAKIAYVILVLTLLIYAFLRYKKHLQLVNELDLEHRQKQAEEERHTERMQFFTNITHELRTPLTLIFGPIEELENSTSLSVEDHQKVTLLHGSANRLLNLINQIMDFRKAETHNKRLRIRHGSIATVTERIANDFALANSNNKLKYLIHIDKESPDVYFDEDVITTILTNLLSNAMKYTTEGQIAIRMSQLHEGGKSHTCITIQDTGCGISKEELPNIFKRYYQARGTHQASGTGIGLALVKTLCELHKIRLDVNSRETEGSIFTLLLDNEETYPEAEIIEIHEEKRISTTIANKNENTDTSSLPVILVVEDNPEINNYIAQNLSGEYIVIQASNGDEGQKAAKTNIPDLIICDIMMPVMDGIAMAKLIKEDITTSHIPIIMLTAKTTVDDRQEGYESGAESYLTKPFSITMLKIRIRNLIESRQRIARYVVEQMNGKHMQPITVTGTQIGQSAGSDMPLIPQLSKLDTHFLSQLNSIIDSHIGNEKLNIVFVASEMGISQSTLYRKVKALTGITTNEYIRKIRLGYAERLMTQESRNISEAAYESGFSDLAYFRQAFKQEYGSSPSEYLRRP